MNNQNMALIWIDLEMTGLDSNNDNIIEIATVITNAHLDIIAEGPVIAIYQPPNIINNLDNWNRYYHGKSGLIDRVRTSNFNTWQAMQKTLSFLQQHIAKGHSPMCGNSICQDRRFLARQMPQLENYFHYRNFDVSTVKEIAKRWYPQIKYTKKTQHSALADIYDSIAELRYYRQYIFKDNING